ATFNGSATFNGDVSIANGQEFSNAGSSLFTAVSISDLPTGGNIGTAAATVDSASAFNINQTTSGQTLTLPDPTNTTAGRVVYVNSVGPESFAMYGVTLSSDRSQAFIWNGTAWTATNIDGAGSGVTAVGALDGTTKSADGAVINANQLFFQTADLTYPGLVSTGNQDFAGDKTFNDDLTVTGAATFNGDLTVSNGNQLTNAGSTLFTAVAVSDQATGGDIGTAAATVDGATTFDVNQTTAGQTLTLPAPTDATSGRIVIVNNVGSVSFTMYDSVISAGQSNTFVWNGSSWITTVSLSGSVVDTIGTLDSQAKSADGGAINSNGLFFQTADGSNPGLVSTGTQSFAGDKTFNDDVTVSGDSTLNGNVSVSADTDSLATFQVQNAASTVLLTADTTNMRIGIGTDTPAYALDVVTSDAIAARFSGRVIGDDAVNNDEFVTLGQANTLYQTVGDYFVQGGNAYGALATLGTTDNQDLRFITNNNEAVRILANGNVGIGTDNPQTLLDVDGDVRIGSSLEFTETGTGGNNIVVPDSSYLRFGADGQHDTHVLVV
ncbi:MAG: hypothetical protein LC650_03085, partial [Actinobacteria bacterium]|nr:hypothetical protein [Actinomycetota bacterium]